mmetsp:Transcript_35743/g.79540  ORF Transcript_35743/g.79540 Transcript_35743/m.79540 type:complete len:356 (+) Transcript_35743:2206-3273(+)
MCTKVGRCSVLATRHDCPSILSRGCVSSGHANLRLPSCTPTMMCPGCSSSKGGRPVLICHRMTPKLYTSLARHICPCSTSGDTYARVPASGEHGVLVPWQGCSILDRPKSATLATKPLRSPLLDLSRMLAGLRSEWMMFCACRWLMPCATSLAVRSRALRATALNSPLPIATSRLPLSQYSCTMVTTHWPGCADKSDSTLCMPTPAASCRYGAPKPSLLWNESSRVTRAAAPCSGPMSISRSGVRSGNGCEGLGVLPRPMGVWGFSMSGTTSVTLHAKVCTTLGCDRALDSTASVALMCSCCRSVLSMYLTATGAPCQAPLYTQPKLPRPMNCMTCTSTSVILVDCGRKPLPVPG